MWIVDTGGGHYPAKLSGTYTEDAVNKKITMGVDGQADTYYILPNNIPWILTEVYDVNGVQFVLGLVAFDDDFGDILVDMEALRQEAILAYTTFVIVTTHYKGNDLADIYKGDESNEHRLRAAYTDIVFTPSTASWKITRDPTAPLYEYYTYPSVALYPANCLYPSW